MLPQNNEFEIVKEKRTNEARKLLQDTFTKLIDGDIPLHVDPLTAHNAIRNTFKHHQRVQWVGTVKDRLNPKLSEETATKVDSILQDWKTSYLDVLETSSIILEQLLMSNILKKNHT